MRTGKLTYKCTSVLSTLLISALISPAYAGDKFSDVFIFGDSLSDSGNAYTFTGETSKAPYLIIPRYPYAMGGHHFSNGKTWAERVAQGLQLNSGGKASLDGPGKNGNYAFGGARARSGSGHSSPDSALQVNMFRGDYQAAPSDALYVIQFGGNDVRDALENPVDGINIIQGAIVGIATNIQTLYAAGAREFMVANSPDLGLVPVIQLLGPEAVAGAGLLSFWYNTFLESALGQLEALPGIKIHRLDIAGFLEDVIANPGDFGISNAASPCLNFMSDSGAKCDNPEEHLFWDGIHPTAAGHNALAEIALGVISGN
jgi:phospholipase/lecithinase/hemolysin